jgi:hypothetical protein
MKDMKANLLTVIVLYIGNRNTFSSFMRCMMDGRDRRGIFAMLHGRPITTCGV